MKHRLITFRFRIDLFEPFELSARGGADFFAEFVECLSAVKPRAVDDDREIVRKSVFQEIRKQVNSAFLLFAGGFGKRFVELVEMFQPDRLFRRQERGRFKRGEKTVQHECELFRILVARRMTSSSGLSSGMSP